MGFSRQEYWRRLPFSTPEGLLNPGIESCGVEFQPLTCPASAGKFATTSTAWEALVSLLMYYHYCYYAPWEELRK